MDVNARVDVNCERSGVWTDEHADGRMGKRITISQPAKAGATKQVYDADYQKKKKYNV